ncbi:MAG: monovalent cation/H(+) antiporter subunit G [Bdellovibrionia bacterium]
MNEVLNEAFAAMYIFGGLLFMILATAGALKFPDFFTRMAAISKASTLGIVLMMIGAGFGFSDQDTWIKVIFIIVFFFFASPIAAHLLGRAAYKRGVRLYIGTQRDDYKNQ